MHEEKNKNNVALSNHIINSSTRLNEDSTKDISVFLFNLPTVILFIIWNYIMEIDEFSEMAENIETIPRILLDNYYSAQVPNCNPNSPHNSRIIMWNYILKINQSAGMTSYDAPMGFNNKKYIDIDSGIKIRNQCQ